MTVNTEVFVSILLTIAQGLYASDNIRLNFESPKRNVWCDLDVHLPTKVFGMSEEVKILNSISMHPKGCTAEALSSSSEYTSMVGYMLILPSIRAFLQFPYIQESFSRQVYLAITKVSPNLQSRNLHEDYSWYKKKEFGNAKTTRMLICTQLHFQLTWAHNPNLQTIASRKY